jgi:DNA-binding winged helix-turn-helix (wHTH) protein
MATGVTNPLEDNTMTIHKRSYQAPDRMNSVFVAADSGTPEPRSASIHLLSPSTRIGQRQRVVQSTRVPPAFANEMAKLTVDIDGLPVLVCLLFKDMPAEIQSDLIAKGVDIQPLLSTMLEKMVDRMRGYPTRTDAISGKPLATGGLISSGEPPVRLPARPNETMLRVGPLELDLLDRRAKRGDRQIDLRPREFQLLKHMMQRSDKLLTRATLFKEVWRYKFVPETNLVDVHMGRLRRKVDGPNDPPMIRNVRGVGFVLSSTPCSQSSPSRPVERTGSLDVADRSPRSVEIAAQ